MTLFLILAAVILFVFAGFAFTHTLQENSASLKQNKLLKQPIPWFLKLVAHYYQYDIVWVWENGYVVPTYRNQNNIKVNGRWYNMVDSDRYYDNERLIRGQVVYSEYNEVLGYYYV